MNDENTNLYNYDVDNIMTLQEYLVLRMMNNGYIIVDILSLGLYLFNEEKHETMDSLIFNNLFKQGYIFEEKKDVYKISSKGKISIGEYLDNFKISCNDYHQHRFPDCFIREIK